MQHSSGEKNVGNAEISLQSAMLVLGGRAFDALENQQKAVQWYVAALEIDAHCYEAFKVWRFA